MEVDSDGCWHPHEMTASDTSDMDDLLIDGIKVILMSVMRIGMQISSHQNFVKAK